MPPLFFWKCHVREMTVFLRKNASREAEQKVVLEKRRYKGRNCRNVCTFYVKRRAFRHWKLTCFMKPHCEKELRKFWNFDAKIRAFRRGGIRKMPTKVIERLCVCEKELRKFWNFYAKIRAFRRGGIRKMPCFNKSYWEIVCEKRTTKILKFRCQNTRFHAGRH